MAASVTRSGFNLIAKFAKRSLMKYQELFVSLSIFFQQLSEMGGISSPKPLNTHLLDEPSEYAEALLEMADEVSFQNAGETPNLTCPESILSSHIDSKTFYSMTNQSESMVDEYYSVNDLAQALDEDSDNILPIDSASCPGSDNGYSLQEACPDASDAARALYMFKHTIANK